MVGHCAALSSFSSGMLPRRRLENAQRVCYSFRQQRVRELGVSDAACSLNPGSLDNGSRAQPIARAGISISATRQILSAFDRSLESRLDPQQPSAERHHHKRSAASEDHPAARPTVAARRRRNARSKDCRPSPAIEPRRAAFGHAGSAESLPRPRVASYSGFKAQWRAHPNHLAECEDRADPHRLAKG